MLNEIKGQPGAVSLLTNFLEENSTGRTIILEGEKGTGKFAAAIGFAETALKKFPYLSPEFNFYRNDDFYLKTRFFLENRKNAKIKNKLTGFLFYLMGRMSAAISLGEIGKSTLKLKKLAKDSDSYSAPDFRNDLETILLNKETDSYLEQSAFTGNLIAVAEELSKKKKIPIDFIRKTIEFHSLQSTSGKRVTVIGDFENATEEAQNSSLKLFEEPSPGSFIILTAENTQAILPTILSRSVILKFSILSPAILEELFGLKCEENCHTAARLMEDSVYHYADLAKNKVKEFFTEIAPKIQHENKVFRFIEEVTSEEGDRLPVQFLEELTEFLRNVFLIRQGLLRSTDLNLFLDHDYEDVAFSVAGQTSTAELKDLSAEIGQAIRGIQYNNVTAAAVLPNLLIDLARWLQKRKKVELKNR